MDTRRWSKRIAVAGATLAVLACSVPTEGFTVTVTQRERFAPPNEYRSWWESVEACSALRGDFDLARWYRAAGITSGGEGVQGIWESPHDITVVRGAEADASIVSHEILHNLLQGDIDHRHDAWVRCNLVRVDA